MKLLGNLLKDFKKLHIIVRILVALIFLVGRWVYKGLMWGNWDLTLYHRW